jgi:hypothetical protein
MRWWREKFPAPVGTRTPDHPARSPVLYHWAIPAPLMNNKHLLNKGGRLCIIYLLHHGEIHFTPNEPFIAVCSHAHKCKTERNRTELEDWVSIHPFTATIVNLLCIPLQWSHQQLCIFNKLQKYVDSELKIITRFHKWALLETYRSTACASSFITLHTPVAGGI